MPFLTGCNIELENPYLMATIVRHIQVTHE